jgi:ELWxxDGT repeat protein
MATPRRLPRLPRRMGRTVRQIALPVAMTWFAAAAWGQPAYLVSDQFPGFTQIVEVAPYGLVTVGSRVFFFGNLGDLDQRSEQDNVGLWVSDGTASGTQPLAKLCVDELSCTNSFLGAGGSSAFFLAGTDDNDHVLWSSDGTRAGTRPLNLGGPALSGAFADAGEEGNHAFLDGVLYFAGCQGNGCNQLWRSDGMVTGTTLVVDFTANPPLGQLTPFRGELYFFGPLTIDAHNALWHSDGTSAGTVPLTVLAGQTPSDLAAAASQLFFVTDDGTQLPYQLWVTDGTAAPHPFARFASAGELKAEGDQVYFAASDGTHGDQLWVSDGTAAGTMALTGFTNLHPFDLPFAPSPDQLEPLGSRLVFFATDGIHPPGLWATAGTPGSTVPLCPGTCGPLDERRLWRIGQRIVALTGSADDGYMLWGTDGTAGGTLLLKQLCSAACIDRPYVQPIGAELFFEPDDGVLWQTDGTAAGTKPYAHGLVTPFSERNGPLSVAALGRQLLFNGTADLRVTDGTMAGTRVLTTGAVGSNFGASGFLALGNQVFFTSALDQVGHSTFLQSAGSAATTMPVPGVTGSALPLLATAGSVFFLGDKGQLWRADGSAAGTRQLTSFSTDQVIGPFAPFRGKLFFAVFSASGIALWQSDGTAQETGKVLDLPPFPAAMELDRMWAAGGLLFYTGIDRDRFVETLWRSDGTAAGTFQLADVPYDRDPEVTAAGGWIYFIGTQETADAELWRTDGTVAGTAPVMVGSQLVGGQAEQLAALTESGGVLYLFVSSDLWRSDGTGSGTFPLHQFQLAEFSSPPATLTVLGSQVLFSVDDSVRGIELWKSDGSVAGTGLVRKINAGQLGFQPSGFAAAAGRVFFTADDGVHGPELWESDGTAGGTRLVQDIWPGPAGSQPGGMVQAGDLLFFSADDGLTGTELWALPLTGATACAPGVGALCLLGDRFKVEALWQDPQGNSGTGQAAALTPDTGYFWFFSPENVEVVAKVIDGRPVDGNFWFFYGALSNVQYWLTVTDTATGAVRRYLNPQGQLASVGDTEAFGPQGAFSIVAPATAPAQTAPAEAVLRVAAEDAAESAGTCRPGPARLCLEGNRFAVTVGWQDFSGRTGNGMAVGLTSDTGTFWFFNAANVELVLKVLDGRAVNGKFWVFFGALSDVAYTVTVRDTVTGSVKTYTNPAGQFASVADTMAF